MIRPRRIRDPRYTFREHIVPVPTYIIIAAILLILTFVTYEMAQIDLGVWNLPVALIIAVAKASLIVLYFMHLKYSTGMSRIVLAAGLLWLGILIVGVLDDVITRGWLPVPGH